MKKKIQALLKNEKGFTLVELLAVIVILGIIAAIAIPSIAGIIDNSKKDAHIANAKQMVGAARLAVAAGDKALWADTNHQITMPELVDAGYLEAAIKDPDGGGTYNISTSFVTVTETLGRTSEEIKDTNSTITTPAKTTAGNVTYKVTLIGNQRSITNIDPNELTRASVK